METKKRKPGDVAGVVEDAEVRMALIDASRKDIEKTIESTEPASEQKVRLRMVSQDPHVEAVAALDSARALVYALIEAQAPKPGAAPKHFTDCTVKELAEAVEILLEASAEAREALEPQEHERASMEWHASCRPGELIGLKGGVFTVLAMVGRELRLRWLRGFSDHETGQAKAANKAQDILAARGNGNVDPNALRRKTLRIQRKAKQKAAAKSRKGK